jgi:hypothetical protein
LPSLAQVSRPCGFFRTTLAPSDREHEATLLFGPRSKRSAGYFSSRRRPSGADMLEAECPTEPDGSTVCPRQDHSWGIFAAPIHHRSFTPTCFKRHGNNPRAAGLQPASSLPPVHPAAHPCQVSRHGGGLLAPIIRAEAFLAVPAIVPPGQRILGGIIVSPFRCQRSRDPNRVFKIP